MMYGDRITVSARKNFYRKAYTSGIYSPEKLIGIYQDYEAHAEGWGKAHNIEILQMVNLLCCK